MSAPPKLTDLSAVKLALMARQVRSDARDVLIADPVAIVGMACRVPGADSAESFWRLLADGVDMVREVPADRWDAAAWYDGDPSAPGKTATRQGAFLERIDAFDAEYFGILPREAQRMDPQQRLFLEVAVEALDDAGLTREGLRGSRTGVFAASYHNDYAQLQYADVDAIDPRTLTGTLHSVLANRLSYFLDLRGPSVSIDTACSSSLVATHLACQSLRFGESDIAVAGGVSLIVCPELLVAMSKVGFMSPDGRCKTFDEAADGFGRGEGCGIVVLKRLSDAVADGDRVLAVIRGSAVNQDGHSTLLAAPSGPAQQALIAEALAASHVEPLRIGLVETHGTGTALGDPIEVEAIAATIGRDAPGAAPCRLGSAKANIGHLEAAAGVAGLIKSVLALRHEAIPPQVHFKRLNPHLSLDGTRLAIPTRLTPWPRADVARCAGVSSFGVGGTNAHVIVEEAPRLPASAVPQYGEQTRLLPLSAHGAGALRELATRWIGFLATTPDDVADLCFTAAQRRTHLPHRAAFVGRSRADLAARIEEFLVDATAPAPTAPSGESPRVAFVFSGQGPQWHAMGRELYAAEAVFRATIDECDRLLRPLAGWSLVDELHASPEASRLQLTEVAQPALFALQAALVDLWRSWGIEPHAVVGHSVGEIAALHAAGVFTLDDGLRIAWHRGATMAEAHGRGAMASVSIDAEAAAALVAPYGGRLDVAALNAPRSVVLAGEPAALDEVLAALERSGVAHRRLPVDYAFHSVQMAPLRRRLVDGLGSLRPRTPRSDVYSTVTGGSASGFAFDADYFGRNLREPVRFASAVAAMRADGIDLFVEVGPHPVLGIAIAEGAVGGQAATPTVVASLRRGRPERDTMLQACAALYRAGAMPAWHRLQEESGDVVSLPPTPWQRQRHWIRPTPASAARGGDAMPAVHPLLGRRIDVAGGACVFEGGAALALRWLHDHRMFGVPVVPAATMADVLSLAAQETTRAPQQLLDFAIDRPVRLPDDAAALRWQIVVGPRVEGRRDIALHVAIADDGPIPSWQRAAGAVAEALTGVGTQTLECDATADVSVDDQIVAEAFAAVGVEFGPSFRCLRRVRRGKGMAVADVELPASASTPGGHHVHPVLLDAALQLCSVAVAADGDVLTLPAAMLPVAARRVKLWSVPTASMPLRARAAIVQCDARGLEAAVELATADGRLVAAIDGLRLVAADRRGFEQQTARRVGADIYRLAWQRTDGPNEDAVASAHGTWLVLADSIGLADAVCAALGARGGRCVRVVPGDELRQTDSDTWTLDPTAPEGWRSLVDAVAPLRGVVHLWSLRVDDAMLPSHADALCLASTLHLVQGLAGARQAAPLALVSRGAHGVAADEAPSRTGVHAGGLWGLGGVVAAEHPDLAPCRFDLDPAESVEDSASRLVASMLSKAVPRDLAWRGGVAHVPRLQRAAWPPADSGVQQWTLARAGSLDGLELASLPRAPLGPDEIRVRVEAAGVNFRDVLVALGMYPGEAPPLGVECAGVVTQVGAAVKGLRAGDAVFGFAPGSLASEVVVRADFVALRPPHWSPEQAAATAVAFLTAQYGLHRLAALRPGERVLIHAAAGGVGLAAVQLALRCGAQVHATAGSPEKRARLLGMGVHGVYDSRSVGFADEVLSTTRGAGVDVVLNSLSGDFVGASLRALARSGRFIEIGKRDILTDQQARELRPDVAYHVYDLGALAQADPALMPPMFDELLAAFADGSLQPMPVTAFDFADAAAAMRHMAQARHVGKIVLRRGGDAPRHGLRVVADASYWITGGLGALGLATAQWLVGRGARRLVLSGRRPAGLAAQRAIDVLRARGAEVRVVQADAGDAAAMQGALAAVEREWPPLRGIVHAAGTLRDGVLQRQSWADMEAVLAGKSRGAWVLHELTAKRTLDFFILYSAAGVWLGAAGQGAYPAANAELDALARHRRRLGMPALSVAWGAWDGDGMAAQGGAAWRERGLAGLTADEAFAQLEVMCDADIDAAAVIAIDWHRFLDRLPTGCDRALFRDVAPRAVDAVGRPETERRDADWTTRLLALPTAQRRAALAQWIAQCALHVLELDGTTALDAQAPLKDVGLDSLMAVELRNVLGRRIGRALPATLLFDHPTLDALASYLAPMLGIAPDAVPVIRETRADADALAALSEAEAEALLMAELSGSRTEAPT